MDVLTAASLAKHLESLERTAALNYVDASRALEPSCAGMRLFDGALVGIARADDALFAALKQQDAVGPHHLLPADWLASAASVVSFFLPFSEEVRAPNRRANAHHERKDCDSPTQKRAAAENDAFPSMSWMHGRIDGQAFVEAACRDVVGLFEAAGATCVCPLFDERFSSVFDREHKRFTSNWSERHVAYICGLGTFGLSKGLITARGTAGRLASFVTDVPLEPTVRPYRTLDEYCTMCGACAQRCPVNAISFEHGKIDDVCCALQDAVKRAYPGFYGCGKCQTGVPCEAARPTGKADRPQRALR